MKNSKKKARRTPATVPSSATKSNKLLSRQQVAERWECCTHTIARRKDIHPVRLGRRLVRYRLEEIEAIEAAAQ
jgi:hypothetical protein